MKTVVKRLYEGMFLVDSALAASDWDGINTAIKTILEKAEAEIISIRKWNECRLAYEIKGKGRGTYILTYFRVDGDKIKAIERDVQLSERLMRVLILNAEHMTQAEVEKETPATLAEKRIAEASAAKESQPAEPRKSPADSEAVIDKPKELELPVESPNDEAAESATTAEPETEIQTPQGKTTAQQDEPETEIQTPQGKTTAQQAEPETEIQTTQNKTTAQQDEPDENQAQAD